MQRSNKILLSENLEKFLSIEGHQYDLSEYEYVIKIDKSDTKELTSNVEEIINFWGLPKVINQRLNLDRALEILVSGKNDIPLWIGVEITGKEIQLSICKRYKKLKVVEQWHQNQETIPFVSKKDLSSTNYLKEFHFAYPAGMYENQKFRCEELEGIVNILNLGQLDYEQIEEMIWQNVENSNANILRLESKDNDGEYVLIDLWNCDQINVLNCYFRAVGANVDFVYRSLHRWNNRLWKDLGPKVKEIENILEEEFVKGRNIVKYESKNAV